MIGYPKPEKRDKNNDSKVCIKCGSKQVVNKTYSLCYDHNQERLHGADWKQDKIKHSEQLLQKKISNYSKLKKASKKSLKQVSEKQLKVNRELSKTYKLIDESREPQCESCGKWHTACSLSHSHTISVARCKELGKLELISDEQNIVLECFEAPTSKPTACHNIWESGTTQQKQGLLTFDRKLAYIEEHDQETYQKFLIQLNDC